MPTKAGVGEAAAVRAELVAAPAVRTTRTAAQAGAGGSATILVAWLYEQFAGEPLPPEVAVAFAATLTALATWIQNALERRRDLKLL